MATSSSIPFATSVLGEQRHVCALFRTPEEEYQTLLPFIRDGIEHGDRVVCIVPRARNDFLDRLRAADIDVDEAVSGHQLEVVSTEGTYTPDGHFDAERMLAHLVEGLLKGRSLGFPVTRLIGHPESALRRFDDRRAFLEYEARLNFELPCLEDTVICTYDLNQVSAGIAFEVLRTHPMAVIGGVLHENPFYVSPDVFLEEHRARNKAHDDHRSERKRSSAA
jgi:hypothetical protein